MNINPILIDIPNQFESSRLILRTPLDGDGNITFPAIQETSESLHLWFHYEEIPTTIQETEELLRGVRANLLLRRSIHLLIFRQDTGEFVGEIQLYDFDWSIPRCSLGFWVRSSMQQQGFMTEAITRVTELGFDVLNMARLEIRTDVINVATCRVAEKAGYQQEGMLRNYHRRRDESLGDTVVYGITRDDFNSIT